MSPSCEFDSLPFFFHSGSVSKRSLAQPSQVKLHKLVFTTKWQSGLHAVPSSHCHRRVFLVTGDAGPSSGRRAGGLEWSVSSLGGVQEGRRRGHGVGIADVLRMQELPLMRHDLGGLLAVEYREIGGHVDKDAGIRRQAAGGLGPHERRGSRAGSLDHQLQLSSSQHKLTL